MDRFTFFALFSFAFLFGRSNLIPLPANPVPQNVSKCALPPPDNFQLEWVGTYWVSFIWDPVPEAAYYRVKVYESSTGKLVASKLMTSVPENNFAVIEDLQPGHSYRAEISSICSNGIESAKTAVID